jgi:hypothetical protein
MWTQAIDHEGGDRGEACCEPVKPRHRCVCDKACYATEGEAQRAVKRMRYRGRSRSYEGPLRPYQCLERRGIWHVGHGHEDW